MNQDVLAEPETPPIPDTYATPDTPTATPTPPPRFDTAETRQPAEAKAWNDEGERAREAQRLARIASVEREIADMQARDAAGRLAPGRRKGSNGSSSVFAMRLDHDERSALEARSDALGLPPSVLARNFVRIGLTRTDARTDEILDRIDAQLVELRALLGR